MATSGTVQAKVSLDYSEFEAAARAVIDISKDVSSFIKTTFAVAFGDLISAAVQKAVSALRNFASSAVDSIYQVIKLGESMAMFAHITNMAAGYYMTFQLAFEKGISMHEAADMLGRNAELITKDSKLFRDVAIRLSEVSLRFEGFWIGFADKVAPGINSVLAKIGEMDFSIWGQRIGEAFETGFEVFYGLIKSGTLFETLSLSLKVGFAEATNYLVYGANLFVSVLSTFFAEIPYLLVAGFKAASSDVARILAEASTGIAAIKLGYGAVFGDAVKPKNSIRDAVAAVPMKDVSGADALFRALLISLKEAKGQFAKEPEPPEISNVKAAMNFGVSSLQKLGLGGTVNGVGGQGDPLVDIGNKQYDQLKVISELLRNGKFGDTSKFPMSVYPESLVNPPKVKIQHN